MTGIKTLPGQAKNVVLTLLKWNDKGFLKWWRKNVENWKDLQKKIAHHLHSIEFTSAATWQVGYCAYLSNKSATHWLRYSLRVTWNITVTLISVLTMSKKYRSCSKGRYPSHLWRGQTCADIFLNGNDTIYTHFTVPERKSGNTSILMHFCLPSYFGKTSPDIHKVSVFFAPVPGTPHVRITWSMGIFWEANMGRGVPGEIPNRMIAFWYAWIGKWSTNCISRTLRKKTKPIESMGRTVYLPTFGWLWYM